MPEVEERGQRRRVVELPDLPDASLRRVPGADDEVPAVGQKRRHEIVVVVDVVLEVGVLEQHDVAGARGEPGPHGVPLAARPLLQNQLHARMAP